MSTFMIGPAVAAVDLAPSASPGGPPTPASASGSERAPFERTLALATESGDVEPDETAVEQEEKDGEEQAEGGAFANAPEQVVVSPAPLLPTFVDVASGGTMDARLSLPSSAGASSSSSSLSLSHQQREVGAGIAADEVMALGVAGGMGTSEGEGARVSLPATADGEESTLASARPDPSARLEPSARLDPSARLEPSARLDPSLRPDPSARLEPSARPDPSARLDPSTRLDPSARLDPSTRLESSTRSSTSTSTSTSGEGAMAGDDRVGMRDRAARDRPRGALAERTPARERTSSHGVRRATQDAEATMSDAAAFESPPVVPALAAGVPAEGVKGVAVVTDPSAAGTRVGDRDVEGGVRAAEAAGHRRALGGEAHGRIHVPELGNVEVRAAGDAAKVDVHVQAEEDHATHVIRAHAPELTAHVQREVPEARIHLDRPSLEGSLAGDPGASRSAAQHDGGGRRDGHADRESIARRPAGTPAEEASAHRRTSRVRIVL